VLIGVVTSAWLALALWGASPYGRYLHHGGADGLTGLVLFVAGWLLMTVAMMLPTTVGLLHAFQPIARGQDRPALVIGALGAGFLAAWAVVGLFMRAADMGLHAVIEQWSWLSDRSRFIGASVLILAGAYQWSALKHRCLTKCRSPRSFVYRYWRGGRPEADAVHMGLAYGRSCIGCCWALMLLMFAVGSGNLAWMLSLGAVMAVEKNVKDGRRISGPVGAVLVVLGVAVAVGA
jgi:predicted metal-binding membrane protein